MPFGCADGKRRAAMRCRPALALHHDTRMLHNARHETRRDFTLTDSHVCLQPRRDRTDRENRTDRGAGMDIAFQRPRSLGLGHQDYGLRAQRQLQEDVSSGGRSSESVVRRVRALRRRVRPSFLRGELQSLHPSGRVPLRFRAGSRRPRLGSAEQRGNASLAIGGEHDTRPELPCLDRGAIPWRHG